MASGGKSKSLQTSGYQEQLQHNTRGVVLRMARGCGSEEMGIVVHSE